MPLLVRRDLEQALVGIHSPFGNCVGAQIITGTSRVLEHSGVQTAVARERIRNVHWLALRVLFGGRLIMARTINAIPEHVCIGSLMLEGLRRMSHSLMKQFP